MGPLVVEALIGRAVGGQESVLVAVLLEGRALSGKGHDE